MLPLLHRPHLEKFWNKAEQVTHHPLENRPVANVGSPGLGNFSSGQKEGAPPGPGMRRVMSHHPHLPPLHVSCSPSSLPYLEQPAWALLEAKMASLDPKDSTSLQGIRADRNSNKQVRSQAGRPPTTGLPAGGRSPGKKAIWSPGFPDTHTSMPACTRTRTHARMHMQWRKARPPPLDTLAHCGSPG